MVEAARRNAETDQRMRDEMLRWEKENLGPGMPEPEAVEEATRGDTPGTTAVVAEPVRAEAVAKKPPEKAAGSGEVGGTRRRNKAGRRNR